MDYINEITQIGIHMKSKSEYLHKALKNAPPGSILICKNGDSVSLFQGIYDKKKYKRNGVKRNPALTQALIQKALMKEYVTRLDYNKRLLSKAIVSMKSLETKDVIKSAPANIEIVLNDYMDSWSPKNMHPIYSTDYPIWDYSPYISKEDRQYWADKEYRANSYNLENKKYRNLDGIALRSKSEMALLEIYKKYNIPAHYDELIRFNGQVKSPDFISMREDGKVFIHEHCGLVTDVNYMNMHKEKLRIYEACGITPWNNLIVTYDIPGGGINMKLAEAEICSKLLDGM